MENEKKWKVYLRKYSLPLLVFFLILIVVLFSLNFLFNAIATTYNSYVVEGTLLNPEPMTFTSEWITNFTFLSNNIVFFLIVTVISLLASATITYKFISNYGSLKKNQKGSSRFTTLKEIQQQYRAVPEIKERYSGGGGVPVSRFEDNIYIDDSAVNNLIIGTTRSGKGETFIFPTIDIYSRAEKQPSMIFNDPKGELFAASKETLESLGYSVEVLNLMNPMQSISYNLLELVKQEFFDENYSLAQQYARSIAFMLYNDPTVQDKFWQNSSTDLCTALILGLCEHCRDEPEKITMYNVALMMGELATETIEDDKGKEISKLDEFFNHFEPHHPARMQYQTINFSSGQTRASILANTNAKLGIFTLDGTAKLTSKNTLDMLKFGFGHWIRGKGKPLSRIEINFPNGSIESIKTDSNGGFSLYHNHHMDIGQEFKIRSNSQTSTFVIEDWNEDTGELKVKSDNEAVFLKSVMQFEKPIALFMICPDYDATFNVIASTYVKQLYTTLARAASNVKSGKCFREIIFMLDEFGNMPGIDGMANILTVCLGRNIRFNLVIQAYSQIEKLYGDDWKTIDGNTNNTFYILTDDHSTADMISKKIGEKTMIVKSRSGQTISLNKSKTENVEARPLLNADELMRLKEGEMIVIRTIKRQDINRKRIQQFPIFNTGKTAMKYRWEYLSEYYDTSKSINDIEIPCAHAGLNLNDIRVSFEKQIEDIPEERIIDEILDISNSVVSVMERKPPKPKEERLELAEIKQHELIKEKQLVGVAAENPENIIRIGNDYSSFEEREDKEAPQKVKNNLPKQLFKIAIKEGEFDEIFGDEFDCMSYERVKELLIMYKDRFHEKQYMKLQSFVNEGIKNSKKDDERE